MNNKIYVGNLSYSTDEDGLREHFGQFGNITDLKLIVDHQTGRSKGFGFITYSADSEADAALVSNGIDLDGRNIKVSIAQDNNRRSGGGGRRNNF